MRLLLLFAVPYIAWVVIALHFVGIVGFALPYLASHFGQAGAVSPWFMALIKIVLIILLVVMPIASILTWMERRQSAMMQDRLGPNRANIGPFRFWGITHFLADALKFMVKEDFVPSKAHKFLFGLAPIMAMAPALIVSAIVPFGAPLCWGQLA